MFYCCSFGYVCHPVLQRALALRHIHVHFELTKTFARWQRCCATGGAKLEDISHSVLTSFCTLRACGTLFGYCGVCHEGHQAPHLLHHKHVESSITTIDHTIFPNVMRIRSV